MTTKTYTLGEILDDLDAEIDANVDAELATDDAEERAALEQYGELLTQRAIEIADLIEEYGREASITVKDLSPRDYVDFGELHSAAKRQWEEREGVDPEGEELRTIYWTAAGVVEAPWYPEDASMQERAVALQSDGVPGWKAIKQLSILVAEVNQHESGNVKSYAERRQERRQMNTPT